MKLNYQYRIYPYTQQIHTLNQWLRICRYLYNRWLGQCLNWWETHRCPVNACPLICHLSEPSENPYFTDLKAQLPGLKGDLVQVEWSGELLDLNSVYSTVLQDVYTSRLKKAMDRYIWGDKDGKRSGRPRFKTTANYRSFKFLQTKPQWLDDENAVLHLPFIGGIPFRLHRPLPNGFRLKTVQVIKKSDGWYVNLGLEDTRVPEFAADTVTPTWDNSMGMDAVLQEQDFLALSDGQKLPALKSFRRTEAKLAAVSRRKAARKCGSDEVVFTKTAIRSYWDEREQLLVDRDINAAINIKRVGLGLFLTINSRSGKIKVSHTERTAMEVLRSLRGLQKPALTR